MASPNSIIIENANVNNLKNISLEIPLNQFVAICGVSGSGKSSFAMDILYAEGSRRYLESLSAFTRIKLKQAHLPDVENIKFLPSAIALKQRPEIPNKRSTVGTISETLNVLRVAFSRLGTHICPNGHYVQPKISISQNGYLFCPECSETFFAKGAEDFSFNSGGKCQTCDGVGEYVDVKEKFLISDEYLTIRQGAVSSWKMPGTYFLPFAAEAQGVDLDIPFNQLTKEQKAIVLFGKTQVLKAPIPNKKGKIVDLEVTYTNAKETLMSIYKKTDSEKTRQKISELLETNICPTCCGSRFSQEILKIRLNNYNIAEVSNLALNELSIYTKEIIQNIPEELNKVAEKIQKEIQFRIKPLLDLGLGYLTLSRAGNTLSTGELQRLQLTKALRNETTGVLYVLDEPSIGLHPENIEGLVKIFKSLIDQGNSLVVVDHDLDVLRHADYFIEIGPEAGDKGGEIIASGKLNDIKNNPNSLIAPFFSKQEIIRKKRIHSWKNKIEISLADINNIKNLSVAIPQNCLISVVGVSGSGKTTLILDGLVKSLKKQLKKKEMPEFVVSLNSKNIKKVIEVDASPIGKNNRSTVGTYTKIFDEVRKLFSETDLAKKRNWTANHFSYNTKGGICETCQGIGNVSLDIQFLPNIDLVCPNCQGSRFNEETLEINYHGLTISNVLEMTLEEMFVTFRDNKVIFEKVSQLIELGLGYLKLGEETPNLSGGEAQRLKLVSEISKNQQNTLFVFDEPSTGLHPLDIKALIKVFDKLLQKGATVIYLEHDPDMIVNSDYVIELGPNSGPDGGEIVWEGATDTFLKEKKTKTANYLTNYF